MQAGAATFSLLLLCGQAGLHQWSVDLYDITKSDDAMVDQVKAESVEIMPDGKTLVTAGYFYDGKSQRSVGEVRVFSVINGSLIATLHGTADTYALRAGGAFPMCRRGDSKLAI